MKLHLTALMLLLGTALFAQDVIIKTDGSEVKAKVEEITTDAIKYHRADNPTGPLYNLAKAEVFMIIYANGTRETYSKPQAAAPATKQNIVTPYDSLMQLSKSNRTWGITGTVLGPLFIAGGSVTIWDGLNNPKYSLTGMKLSVALGAIQVISGAALLIVGPIGIVQSKKQKAAAAQLKTTALQITYPMPTMLAPNAPGIGFSMKF